MNKTQGYAGGKTRTYIPEALGNRERQSPVLVNIRQPTNGERRELMANGQKIAKRNDGGVEMDALDVLRFQRSAVEKFVATVVNYANPDGEVISTGAQLWEHGEDDLVLEVAAEILSGKPVSTEEKKHSSEPSDSKSQEMQVSSGTAASAEQQG